MSNNNFTDSSFNLYQAYSYTLFLQLQPGSFSYAVTNGARLVGSAQNCDAEELARPKLLAELLSSTYKKVVVGLPATGLTLVPKSIFRADQVNGFARLLDVKPAEQVFAQALDDQNVIIYKTPETSVASIRRFGVENVVYAGAGWIKAIADKSPSSGSLYIEVAGGTLHFLYFALNKIRFYNQFEFASPDELVYFTGVVAEELQLSAQRITLIVSGEINAGDDNMERLAEFYPKIEINGIKVIEMPAKIVSHRILSLAALSLCGSSEGL